MDAFIRRHAGRLYTLINPMPRVTVLTDEGVMSSGEAVVVSFRERTRARSFGTATCGVSTATARGPNADQHGSRSRTSWRYERSSSPSEPPFLTDREKMV